MRYPETFRQELIDQDFDGLPEFCEYIGNADDLKYLRGKLIPTRRVQELVYVGERENIVVQLPNGALLRPWDGVWIYEVDENGNPKIPPIEPIVEPTEPTMSTADLASIGYTDADLDKLSRDVLGAPWEPDRPGPSVARKRVYDAVMARLYS